MAFDDDTYGWAYAPPGHLPGEPAVPIPNQPPGAEIPANQPTRLSSGVVALRETYAEHDRLAQLDAQAKQARQAAEQAARDAQMYGQMMRVAKSTKDIEIAKRSIDMMGLQRDIQSGVPIHLAVQRHPMGLGSGFGAALRATEGTAAIPAPKPVTFPGMPPGVQSGRYGERYQFAPQPSAAVPAPSVINLPGMPPAVRSGRYGERVQFPPDAAAPQMPTPTREEIAPGVFVVRTGPNRFQVLEKGRVTGDLTELEHAQLAAIGREETSLLAEMRGSPKRREALQQDLLAVQRRRNTILRNAGGAPAPVQAPPSVITHSPLKITTKAQRDALPSGTQYIGPDGRTYTKQ